MDYIAQTRRQSRWVNERLYKPQFSDEAIRRHGADNPTNGRHPIELFARLDTVRRANSSQLENTKAELEHVHQKKLEEQVHAYAGPRERA